MAVYILSRESAEKKLKKGDCFSSANAVISFYDPEYDGDRVDYSSVTDRVFYVGLPDLSYDDLQDYGYTPDTFFTEADELAQFIIRAHNDGCEFVFQCEHGESRSAAAAAAVMEFYDRNGIKVFANYRFCPNQLIFNKIYDALQRVKK